MIKYSRPQLTGAGRSLTPLSAQESADSSANCDVLKQHLSALGLFIVLTSIKIPQPQVDVFTIQYPVRAHLGKAVEFLGYDLDAKELKPNDTLHLTLYWQARERMNKDYTVFVHLLGEDGQLLAQADSQPQGGNYPTSLWEAGEVIVDRYELPIPGDTPSGRRQIEVGMYLLSTMERLPVFDEAGKHMEGDRILLSKVRVEGA